MPAVLNCCCLKGSAPYWSNQPFLIFDIRALWCSGLSARAPECQKSKWWVRPVSVKCKALTSSAVKGLNCNATDCRDVNYSRCRHLDVNLSSLGAVKALVGVHQRIVCSLGQVNSVSYVHTQSRHDQWNKQVSK